MTERSIEEIKEKLRKSLEKRDNRLWSQQRHIIIPGVTSEKLGGPSPNRDPEVERVLGNKGITGPNPKPLGR